MPPHRFKVGQNVNVSSRVNQTTPMGKYQVVRLLPPDSADNQYRLKSAMDGRERVVWESELS